MSERPEQPEPAEAPVVWCIVLEPLDRRPDGTDPGPLPDRMAAAVALAQSRGLTLLGVKLCFVVAPELPEGVTVRAWLKRMLRDEALRARWPKDGGAGERGKADRGPRRATPGRGKVREKDTVPTGEKATVKA